MQTEVMTIVAEVNSWYREANAPLKAVISYILDQILANFEGFSILNEKGEGKAFVWNGVYFEYITLAQWGRILRQIFKDSYLPFTYKIHSRNELHKTLLEQWELPFKEVELINGNETVLPFKNGFYFRESQEFIPAGLDGGLCKTDPRFKFNTCIDVNYPDDYEPPVKFLTFLAQLIKDPAAQQRVLEYFAYCLTPRIDWQFHLVLVGPPNCGKSEFTKFLSLLIPDLCVYIPLDILMDNNKNKFLGPTLRGKWVNIGAEVSGATMTSGGVSFFKRLTGEKYIWTDEKNNPDAKKVRNRLKAVYPMNNTNKPNTFVDTAFFQRLEIEECQEFEGAETSNLAEQIFEEEGPMIARYLVELPLPEHHRWDAEESEQKWMDNLHSAFLYFDAVLIPGESRVTDLYENYRVWCEDHNKYPAKLGGLGRLLKTAGVNKSSKMLNGERFYVYDHTSIYLAEEHRVMDKEEIEMMKFCLEDYV